MQERYAPINGQLFKRRRLVADRTQPLWTLLLKLQVRGGVKALEMRASHAPTGNF